MIEVNLFSVSSSDPKSMVGRCVSRSRFKEESVGVGVMGFVKGFLKENLDQLQSAISNDDLVSFINGSTGMTLTDFQSINYHLGQAGYQVTIWSVTDDEENPLSVPEGTIEYNVINHNYLDNDFPTVTKKTLKESETIIDLVKSVVEQSGLFNEDKLSGVRNPFTILLNNLTHEKEVAGNINYSLITRVYQLLDQLGFNIYCATPEN
jgi:hypothetical protein